MAPKESLALPADVRTWLACDYQLGLEQNSMNFTKNSQQRERGATKDWAAAFAKLDFAKMTNFELSVRLMRTVEFLEHNVPPEGSELQAHLTTIMNCEYQIYRLNAATPLRNNPFLTYWLRAADAIQKELVMDLPLEGNVDSSVEGFTQLVSKARLNIIHHALMAPEAADGVKVWSRRHTIHQSPEQMIQSIVNTSTARFLDLKGIDINSYEQFGIFALLMPSMNGRQIQTQGLLEAETLMPESSRSVNSVPPSTSKGGSVEAVIVETRLYGSSDQIQTNEMTSALTADSRLGGSPFSGSPRVGSPLISSPLNDGSRSGRSGTASPLNDVRRNGNARNGGAHFSAADLRDRFASPGESSHSVNMVEHTQPMNAEDIVDGSDRVEEDDAITITSKTSVLDILNYLQGPNPADVIHALTRLRIDLNSLELLTNLLTSPELQHTPLEPGPLVCGYIQHSLRTVEHMAWNSSPRSGAEGDNSDDIFSDAIMVGGRDDQTRAVKLLVLFLKNLLKRSIVQHQELYFDVEEICVRYIWIPEVRDFRKFLEGTDLIMAAGLGGVPQGG